MAALLSELEAEGFSLPNYGRSNVEVLKQIARGRGGLAGDREKKVFLLIDGLGYELLDRLSRMCKHTHEATKAAHIEKLTTVFPSFTITALSSIDSGLTVAEHGIAGEKLPLKEAGVVVSILSFAAQFDQSAKLSEDYSGLIYPKPHTLNRLRKKYGFLYVQDEHIVGREYTRSMFGGADTVTYVSFEDMLLQVAKAVKSSKYERIYAYHPIVDHSQHVYGPNSPEVALIVESAMLSLSRILLPVLEANDYNLVITADHGQVEVMRSTNVSIGATNGLMQYLDAPIWGMGRAPILSVADGMEKKAEDFISRKYSKMAMLVESDEMIKSGIFGRSNVAGGIRYRFGTHMLVPKGSFYFSYLYPGKELRLRGKKFGHHGGLSSYEMEVPLVLF